MNCGNIKATFRKFIIERFNPVGWNSPFAVTLTFRLRDNMGNKVDIYTCKSSLRKFLMRIDRIYFKNRIHRGACLQRLVCIEQDAAGRFHAHLALEGPPDGMTEEFCYNLFVQWRKNPFGYREHHIQPLTSAGWLAYITKLRSKANFFDYVDLENSRVLVAQDSARSGHSSAQGHSP